LAGLKSFGGVGRALHNRNFRRYWFGLVISTIGFWMFRVTLGWYTWELTNSPAWLGIIGFSSLIPVLVFGPIAGALADRVGHKRVAMSAMVLSCITALLMAYLIVSDLMTIHVLFFTATLLGGIISFDFPARHAMVSDMVERKELSAAIALNMSTFHVGSFIGPIVGGYIVVEAGIAASFIVFAFTTMCFFFALLFVYVTPVDKSVANETVQRSTLLNDILTGLLYLIRNPALKWMAILNLCGAMLLRPYMDLLPGYADVIFNRSVDGLSLLIAASGLGAFTGSFLLAMRGKTQGLTKILLLGLGIASFSLILFATTSNFLFGQICLFFGAMTLVGASVCSNSLIQHAVEPHLRGRVISLVMSMGVGGMAVGSLSLGMLGEFIGLRWPIIGGALVVLVILIFVVKPMRAWAAQLEATTT
jgi:MFS family permease